MNVCEKDKCTGCFACVDICPKNCITMEEGVNGHIFPKCDESKCINCNLCARVCQGLEALPLNTPIQVYAAWNNNAEEQKESSSGGIAALLAKTAIENNGVVYGAAFDDEWNVKHIRCTTSDELKKIKQSKYVQSWIGDCYSLAKSDLVAGREVLFTGTPCQVAGLYKFLGKEYDNLYTVDIVCHGVPSRKVYKEELNNLLRGRLLKQLAFRGKKGYGFYMTIDNEQECFDVRKSYYIRGFVDGLFFRESCYSCPYANTNRMGDITLGDFWGIGKIVAFTNPENRKVSLVLVNTPKGRQKLEQIFDNIYCEERDLEEAKQYNHQLWRPVYRDENYTKFSKSYSKSGFLKSAKKCYPKMRLRLLLEKLHIYRNSQNEN